MMLVEHFLAGALGKDRFTVVMLVMVVLMVLAMVIPMLRLV